MEVSSQAIWATKISTHVGANDVAQMSRRLNGQICSHTREQDVSAKKLETFRQCFHAETSCIILVLFLVLFLVFYKVVCKIPVGRILELKKNDKKINIGMMQSIKRASDMSPFPLVPRGPLGLPLFPSC